MVYNFQTSVQYILRVQEVIRKLGWAFFPHLLRMYTLNLYRRFALFFGRYIKKHMQLYKKVPKNKSRQNKILKLGIKTCHRQFFMLYNNSFFVARYNKLTFSEINKFLLSCMSRKAITCRAYASESRGEQT